eukprot:758184-Hanusia_phi.AAC.5
MFRQLGGTLAQKYCLGNLPKSFRDLTCSIPAATATLTVAHPVDELPLHQFHSLGRRILLVCKKVEKRRRRRIGMEE